ncbi:hypothetical protein BE21_27360 [Sorangium cellulosum]|uniref:Uncharacterized protein n=1 Tax=Sorangium cellulosum TaxID=56 RepID=A0A150TT30_SORCE|nr:hypothetical protein BE21_27360 [Sorangium cellulosum]
MLRRASSLAPRQRTVGKRIGSLVRRDVGPRRCAAPAVTRRAAATSSPPGADEGSSARDLGAAPRPGEATLS